MHSKLWDEDISKYTVVFPATSPINSSLPLQKTKKKGQTKNKQREISLFSSVQFRATISDLKVSPWEVDYHSSLETHNKS